MLIQGVGVYVPEGALSPEVVAERWSEISDMTNSVRHPPRSIRPAGSSRKL
jgi:hypothetical protein